MEVIITGFIASVFEIEALSFFSSHILSLLADCLTYPISNLVSSDMATQTLNEEWQPLAYSSELNLPFFIMSLGSQNLSAKMKYAFSNFRKIFIPGTILITLLGIWMFYTQIIPERMQAAKTAYPSVSESVYKQTLPGLDREPIRLEQLQGKVIYIKFWATWCPLCLAGLEDFTSLVEQLSSSPDIAVISIVTPGLNGETSRNDFIEWARAQKLAFPIYFDESGTVSKEFGIQGYPATVYLAQNGIMVKKTAGDETNAQILYNLASLGDK